MDHTKTFDNPPPYHSVNHQNGQGSLQFNPMPMPSAPSYTTSAPMHQQFGQPHHHHHQQFQQVSVITAQPSQSQSTVIVQTSLPVNSFSGRPHAATCHNCRKNVTTSVTYSASCKTHFFAVFLCVMGCFCGCCLIPYCVDSCQGATHTCPSCGALMGSSGF